MNLKGFMMNMDGFLDIIPSALTGWINVFAVTLVIVLLIAILNKVCK